MADDIDIEEHDVLDNPRLRNIFPDITRIKEEVIEPEDDEEFHEEYEPYEQDHRFQISTPYHDPTTYVENTQEFPRHNNKIILGSKPSGEIVVKQEPVDSSPDTSKHSPNTSKQDCPTLRKLLEYDDDIDNIKPSTVLLEDWGPKLAASRCFCSDCDILFPTRNALDAHKMAAHSFLVAVNTNKAVKSTAKTAAGNPEDVPGTSKFCNHCNKTFVNDTALITHLYEILTSGKAKKTPVKSEVSAARDKTPVKTDLIGPKSKPTPTVKTDLIGPKAKPTPTVKTDLIGAKAKSTPIKSKVVDKTNKTPGNIEPMDQDDTDQDSQDIKYLQCPVCGIVFQKETFYLRHLDSNHGLKTHSSKLVAFDGKCWYCPSTFGSRSAHCTHMLKLHPKVFYSKKGKPSVPKMKENVKVTSEPDRPQYTKIRCSICRAIFPDYTTARQHRHLKHPELKNKSILQKVVCKSAALPFPIKKPKPASNPTAVVHTKTLFRCNNCDIHFMDLSSGLSHVKNCQKADENWQCQLCRRKFLVEDMNEHERSHKIGGSYAVYSCHQNLYYKVLNSCPKCGLYLHENGYNSHYKECSGKSKSVDCNRCKISIETSSSEQHEYFHNKFDFARKDLILVERDKNVNVLKRKLDESDQSSASKKQKSDESQKFTFYFCKFCKCSMKNTRNSEAHLEAKCLDSLKIHPRICKYCGIMVSSKRHKDFHEKNKNWKLSNFKFINLHTRRAMNPPIPEYPSCAVCGVNVIQESDLENHECGADYKKCWYCKKKFTDLAYILHTRLHKNGKPKDETSHSEPIPPVQNELPELLKKYEQLTKTWNILYLCETCDIVQDSYDAAVDHCHDHYNKMESYDVTIRHCEKCDIKFNSKFFDRHVSLHSQNDKIRKDSFQLLKYNFCDLLSPKWLDIFQSLTEEQTQHILNQSIYKHTRSYKLTIITNGPPEYTLYLCGKCYLYSQKLDKEFHSDCSEDQRRFHCRICNIPFVSHGARDAHEAMHNKTEDFRVVLFNESDTGGQPVNAQKIPKSVDPNPKKSSKSVDANPKKSPKISNPVMHYYKCTKCKCCVKLLSKATHDCSRMTCKKVCSLCGYLFWTPSLSKHMSMHSANPKCSRADIRITYFTPGIEENTATIFKCTCGLHFISMKNLEKHRLVCGDDTNITKEKCSKCNLLFDTHELFNHLCKHHSLDNFLNFDVQEIGESQAKSRSNVKTNKVIIYKCKDCNMCYLTEASLKYHLDNNHEIISRKRCDKCDQTFGVYSLKKHEKLHHSGKYKPSDFEIVSLDNATTKSVEHLSGKSKVPNKVTITKKIRDTMNFNGYSRRVYKCRNCPWHFISRGTLMSHRKDNRKYCSRNNIGHKCEVCGLVFSKTTLSRHMYIHHDQMKLHKMIVVPEIGDPDEENNSEEEPSCKFVKTDSKQNTSVTAEGTEPLYQCGVCKVNFFHLSSLKAHFTYNRHNQPKKKCSKCGILFHEISLPKHITLHHDQMKLKRKDFKILVKMYNFKNPKNKVKFIVNSKNKVKVIAKRNSSNHKNMKDVKPSVQYSPRVFKCGSCDAHFLRPRSIHIHCIRDRHDFELIKCDECSLTFGEKTLCIHKQIHHRHMKLKNIEVVEVAPNFATDPKSEKLYKCAHCGCHFLHIKSIDDHLLIEDCARQIKKPRTINCDICGLLFKAMAVNFHKLVQHEKMKLGLDDFVIHEVGTVRTKIKPRKKAKPVVSDVSESETEPENTKTGRKDSKSDFTFPKMKNQVSMRPSSNSLFKCRVCSVHFLKESTAESHVKSSCPSSPIVCTICNLKFSEASFSRHKEEQHDQLKLGPASDFFIIPFYERNGYFGNNYFYRCSVCKLHFSKLGGLELHLQNQSHDMSKIRCEHCGLDITCWSYKRHVLYFHKQSALKRKDFVIWEWKDGKFVNVSSDPGQSIPDWKSRLDLDSYDNTIYKCDNCLLHFISPEAIHNHRNCRGVTPRKNNTCSKCKLDFGKKTLAKHIYIHHEFHQLKREDFRIITKYKRENLGSETEEMETQSTKSNSESVATNEEIDYSKVIYRCSICKFNFVTIGTLKSHDHDMKCKCICYECGLIFSRCSLSKHKNKHHTLLKLRLEDFTIIDESGQKVNDTDKVQESDLESSRSKDQIEDTDLLETSSVSTNMSEERSKPRTQYDSNLYKCDKCNTCFMEKRLNHFPNCNGKVIVRKCSICGYSFPITEIRKHKYVHHQSMKLSADDFKINDLSQFHLAESITESISDPVEEDATDLSTLDKGLYNNELYKCTICDTHFVSKRCLAGHMRGKHEVPKIRCSICELSFPLKTLPVHRFIHHEEMKLSPEHFLIITDKDVNNDSINHENVNKKNLNQNRIDSECKIDNSKNKKTDDSLVQSTSDLEMENLNLSVSEIDKTLIKLFKCGECNVYFLSQTTCLKHMTKHVPLDTIEYIECKLCGFQFTITCLRKHIMQHHSNKEFKLENVRVEEYVTDKDDLLKVDMYFAKDKLQSRLVSTTSEKSVTPTKLDAPKSNAKPCTVTSNAMEVDEPTEGTINDNVTVDNEPRDGTENEIIAAVHDSPSKRFEIDKLQHLATKSSGDVELITKTENTEHNDETDVSGNIDGIRIDDKMKLEPVADDNGTPNSIEPKKTMKTIERLTFEDSNEALYLIEDDEDENFTSEKTAICKTEIDKMEVEGDNEVLSENSDIELDDRKSPVKFEIGIGGNELLTERIDVIDVIDVSDDEDSKSSVSVDVEVESHIDNDRDTHNDNEPDVIEID